MRTLFFIICILFTNPTMAQKSASLQPTGTLEVAFENQTEFPITDMRLVPQLYCRTSVLTFGYEVNHYINFAEIEFQQTQNTLQILTSNEVFSPHYKLEPGEHKISYSCGIFVRPRFKIENIGLSQLTRYPSIPMGYVSSKLKHEDLTERFVKKFPGKYVFKIIDGGTGFDPKTQKRVKVCNIGFFKELSPDKFESLGHIIGVSILNCSP